MERCPGCGLELDPGKGPSHPYIGSSSSCWALFCELLAREFTEPDRFLVHRLTVDAYAAQHPGQEERRSIKSVGIHLMGLCLVFEHELDPERAMEEGLLDRLIEKHPTLTWLQPPEDMGSLTVLDVLRAEGAEEHRQAVREWAGSVWQAWADHHDTVRRWVAEALTSSPTTSFSER